MIAKKKRNELNILLMQIREDPHVANEELESFARHAGLKKSQIAVLNLFKTASFDKQVMDHYDALWVGGASEANVLQPREYPFVNKAKKLLLYCRESGIPVFASCFGFQLAVLALGGSIINSNDEFEMGCIQISLAKSASTDLLLEDTPNDFMAVSVHRQKAISLPPECELLAYTNSCIHAIKVRDRPFWAFQFHPEIDRNTLIQRLTIYKDCYTENDEQLEQVIALAQETPESNVLVKKFIDRVLLGE